MRYLGESLALRICVILCMISGWLDGCTLGADDMARARRLGVARDCAAAMFRQSRSYKRSSRYSYTGSSRYYKLPYVGYTLVKVTVTYRPRCHC